VTIMIIHMNSCVYIEIADMSLTIFVKKDE
jgi:hypothetical protein